MRTRLLWTSLGLLVGVAGVLATHYLIIGTRLEAESGSISALVSEAEPGATYTFAAARVCVDGPQDVVVTDVRAATELQEVELVDFAIMTMQALGNTRREDIATYAENLKAARTGPPTRKVSTRCSAADDARDLVVQLTAPSALPAVVTTLEIDYRAGGRTRTITTSDSLVLCSGTQADRQVDELAESTDLSIASCDR